MTAIQKAELKIKAAEEGSDTNAATKYLTRPEVLAIASEAIEYLHDRTCSGKQFREKEAKGAFRMRFKPPREKRLLYSRYSNDSQL